MTLQQQFQDLNNRLSTRKELEKLLIAAKLESNSEIIFRISKVFNAFPEKNEFVLTIKPFQENGLLGAIHTGDYKEALDDCGRLRKGYKFLNGRIAKVEPKKPVATKTTTRSKVAKRILAETPKKVKQQIIKTAIKLVEKPVLKVTDVLNISILKIFTDEKRFQNRNKLNETVLAQIMENYSSQKFDAIVIWHDPKLKKDFVLAGHHRFEAVKRLGKKFVMTKYFNGSEAEAIKYAKVESNANRSLELPQERANIYREMFVKGMSKTNILAEAKKLEGKNANYIVNLSFLNPKGLTLQALNQLSETPDKQNETLIVKIADWAGEARRNNEQLTNAHEKEIFDFLKDKNSSIRIKTKAEFLQKIIASTGLYFDYSDALNLKKFKYETTGETIYNQEYKDLQTQIENAIGSKQNLIDRIKNPLNKDFIDPKDKDYKIVIIALEKAIEKYNNEIKVYQSKLIDLSRKKENYTNAGSNQVGLFGSIYKEPSNIEFNKQITKAMKKGYFDADIFSLGKPYDILKKYVSNFNIVLSGKVLRKSMSQEIDHNLNWNNYIDLNYNLNNPNAIFKSKTKGIVVLTEIIDVNNKPILIVLHINNNLKTTNIASIYVRNNKQTYKNWAKQGLMIYAKKESEYSYYTQATIAVGLNKSLSKNKDNKNNTNNPNSGLNISKSTVKRVVNKRNIAAPIVVSSNRNSLAYKMANKPVVTEYFTIDNKDLSGFLGNIERKTKESVVISLTGGQGSMKTRNAFQFMNALAQNYKVGHTSIEEHPESSLYFDKAEQYLNEKALDNIEAPEVKTVYDLEQVIKRNDVIVIDSFTKMQEMHKGFEVDKDLRKKHDGKLFLVIFQQTTDGKMRGGSKSQFDADIVLFTKKEADYRNNYVYADKNRYQDKPLDGLHFNIFNGKLVAENPDENENVNIETAIEKINELLSFNVN